MKKRFATLEISLLILSILTVSVFMFQDFNQKSITGYGFFDAYTTPDSENSYLGNSPEESLSNSKPPCSDKGGTCLNRKTESDKCLTNKYYNGRPLESWSNAYTCYGAGQICCMPIKTSEYIDPLTPVTSCAEKEGKCIGKNIFGTYSCSGNKDTRYSCSKPDQVCCLPKTAIPQPMADPSNPQQPSSNQNSDELIYELVNNDQDLVIGTDYLFENDEIVNSATGEPVEGSKRICGCNAKCANSSSCSQKTKRVLINGGWENALSCEGKCTGEDCGACRWRQASTDIPTSSASSLTEKTYSNICAYETRFEWKYLMGVKLAGTDSQDKFIYDSSKGYQFGCLRESIGGESCSNNPLGTLSGLCSFRTVTVYTNGFKESENAAPNYFGVLGDSYLEEEQSRNIFVGYEVQYDDSGDLVYELTNDRTQLAIGATSSATQEGNTITISTPASDSIKKECKCRTKKGGGTDCSPIAGTSGCLAQKMQSGPYYGCIGICRGADCDSGNSCSFYNKKGDALGELIKS